MTIKLDLQDFGLQSHRLNPHRNHIHPIRTKTVEDTMKRPTPVLPTISKRLAASVLIALFAAMALAPQASAQDDKLIEDPDIIIEVDGIACPFCAYGIEKRLKKIDGVAELSVLLEEGRVQLKMEENATVSEERLREAIAEAGFDARSIVFVNEEARTSSGAGR